MNKIKKVFEFFKDDTPYYAASLSFFTIFSLLPLIALLIVVVSALPAFATNIDLIMIYIMDFINPTHSTQLANTLNDFLVNTDKLGSIGIFYLLFVFTMFFKDYEYIINKIYNTPNRALYKLFFLYLGFLILIPIMLFIFIFASTLMDFSFAGKFLIQLFVWFLFILLFLISANIKVSLHAASISSAITLVALNITKTLFAYYVLTNTTYSTIYGSFSIALFFFLWIYVSWNIYLYGIKLCYILNKNRLLVEDIKDNNE